jgi:hypothetical protein
MKDVRRAAKEEVVLFHLRSGVRWIEQMALAFALGLKAAKATAVAARFKGDRLVMGTPGA